MKELVIRQIPSITRWLLALLGSWIATKNLGVFEDVKAFDWANSSLGELLTGIIILLVTLALKKANEFGTNGLLAKLFVGPKVKHLAPSIARWLLGIIAGATVAYIGMNADQLSNATIATVCTAAFSFLVDRFWKAKQP